MAEPGGLAFPSVGCTTHGLAKSCGRSSQGQCRSRNICLRLNKKGPLRTLTPRLQSGTSPKGLGSCRKMRPRASKRTQSVDEPMPDPHKRITGGLNAVLASLCGGPCNAKPSWNKPIPCPLECLRTASDRAENSCSKDAASVLKMKQTDPDLTVSDTEGGKRRLTPVTFNPRRNENCRNSETKSGQPFLQPFLHRNAQYFALCHGGGTFQRPTPV